MNFTFLHFTLTTEELIFIYDFENFNLQQFDAL